MIKINESFPQNKYSWDRFINYSFQNHNSTQGLVLSVLTKIPLSTATTVTKLHNKYLLFCGL